MLLKRGAGRLVDRSVETLHSELFAQDSVRDFVDDFYACDALLYQAVRSGHSHPITS
jgi:hypothetical protein